VAPGGVVTITFEVTADDLGEGCWFVSNEAIIGSGSTQQTRETTTAVGDCHVINLPVVTKGD
jgi:hypothetical protein